MGLKFETRHIIAIIVALLVVVFDFVYFSGTRWILPVIVIAITIGWMPYWIDFFMENKRRKGIEEKFPDFVRNLVGAIKSGMPVSRSIIHVAEGDYGALNPYVKRLARQVEWAIPIHRALSSFSSATKSPLIQRAISTVIEAEKSGGNIEDVLDSITHSLTEIKEIKQKRVAGVHTQVVQSYIIFFVFLGVMVVIQNLLIPYVSQMQGTSVTGIGGGSVAGEGEVQSLIQKVNIDFSSVGGFVGSLVHWLTSLDGVFLMLALIQGMFAGFVIGKLSEGNIRYGIKHSLILMTIALFVMSLAGG